MLKLEALLELMIT